MKAKSEEMKQALDALLPRMGVECVEVHYKAARLSSPIGPVRLAWKQARGVWVVKEVGVKKGVTYASESSAAGALMGLLDAVRERALECMMAPHEEEEEEEDGDTQEEAPRPATDQISRGHLRTGGREVAHASEDDHQGAESEGEDEAGSSE